MSYWLYQGQAEPVEVPAAQDASTYGWRNEWLPPTTRPFAVALIALVTTISPYALTQPEASSVDKWYEPLSEPVRQKSKLISGAQQFLSFGDTKPIVSFGWYGALTEPVRYRVFYSALQRFFTEDTDVTPDPAIVPWYVPFNEPTRLRYRPTLPAPYQQTIAFDPFPLVNRGVMGWFSPLEEPVRIPKRLQESNQSSVAFVFAPEVITVDKWFAHLSQPYLVKWFDASLQQAYTNDSELFPQPSELIQWFANLSEPVRDLKVGLSVRLQMTLAIPERILPTPDVTITLSAIETNEDIASFAIEVSNLANTAVVSIEEIPSGNDAIMSIREP